MGAFDDYIQSILDDNDTTLMDDMCERVSSYDTKIVGFDDELDTLYHSLGRYKKRNVLLIGKAGVGKTALVEKFCQEINDENVPKKYLNKKVFELSLNSTIAGTRYRGQFEERVKSILDNVKGNEDIILFVDEIHNIMSLGAGTNNNGAMSLSETLKPYLARNEITLIGATTEKEYKRFIKCDDAFDRRFNKVYVKEPSFKDTLDILKSYKDVYEKHYGIFLRENELKQVLVKSILRRGNNPDKALDELEDFCYERSKDNE